MNSIHEKIQSFHQFDTPVHTEDIINWRDNINTLQSNGWFSQIEEYDHDFTGYVWSLCNKWFDTIPLQSKPIRYLEIGTLCGANLLSVAKTYASHPDSKLECIDIWEDTREYSEYKQLQTSNYQHFLSNMERNGLLDSKLTIYKDYSYNVLPRLENNAYDMIYIDANHESWAVLEDGVHAFRKCKSDGWIIFDDYTFSEETQQGIDSFLDCFSKYISKYYIKNGQAYVHLCKLN